MTFPIIPASTVSGDYRISRSLRFRNSATAYLSRTIGATATNAKIGTLSLWVKRGALTSATGNSQYIIQTGNTSTSDSGHFTFFFTTTDNISLGQYSWAGYSTTQVFRDPSAWYHILLSYNSTLASNNLTIYVNGVSIGVTTVVQNTNWAILSGTEAINIGRHTAVGRTFDGYLAEINLIDGQALTPSSFGQSNALTGVWEPKAYVPTGTGYGTNGFYLQYSDPSGSGNGNDTYTKLLLHGNGLNDSAWNGSSNHALTAFGSATTSTTKTKFGMSSSLYTLGSSSQYYRTDASSDFLYGATSGSTNDFTVDWWFYPDATGSWPYDSVQIGDGAALSGFYFAGATFYASSNGSTWDIANNKSTGSPVPGQWNHRAFVRSGSTWYIFLNGTLQDTWTNSSAAYNMTTTNYLQIGRVSSGALYSTGWFQEIRWSAGIARWTSAFTPPTTPYSGGAGSDSSGNVNAWRPFNINTSSSGTTYDSMIDSPTNYADGGNGRGNYAVLNPLDANNNAYCKNGNLRYDNTTASYSSIRGTIAIPSSGKYYMESSVGITVDLSRIAAFGLAKSTVSLTGASGTADAYWLWGGYIYLSTTQLVSIGFPSAGDVQQVAVDTTNGKMWLGRNNTWYDSSGGTTGNPSTGANPTTTVYMAGFFPFMQCYNDYQDVNFGQRPFAYTPPSGFSALNTQNLPAPALTPSP